MKVWLLWAVPDHSRGRLVVALVTFAILFCVFWSAGVFAEHLDRGGWPAALFFCVIVAYILPIFQFITRRTEEAFDELVPVLGFDHDHAARLRHRIAHRSPGWVVLNLAIGITAWLAQSFLLAGGTTRMTDYLLADPYSFVMSTAPLLVWLTVSCAVHALVDNARLFRQLAREVDVDVLDSASLNPFGRMAVSSTLVLVGAQASFAIMWLGPQTNPWTTIPGVIATTIPMLFLLVAPVWPLHRALSDAKRRYIEQLQAEINALGDGDYERLAPLLAVRREVASTSEWPVDLGIVTRLGLYLFIVPLTWIGAALIEMLVEVSVG